jgi:hypothetical protein
MTCNWRSLRLGFFYYVLSVGVAVPDWGSYFPSAHAESTPSKIFPIQITRNKSVVGKTLAPEDLPPPQEQIEALNFFENQSYGYFDHELNSWAVLIFGEFQQQETSLAAMKKILVTSDSDKRDFFLRLPITKKLTFIRFSSIDSKGQIVQEIVSIDFTKFPCTNPTSAECRNAESEPKRMTKIQIDLGYRRASLSASQFDSALTYDGFETINPSENQFTLGVWYRNTPLFKIGIAGNYYMSQQIGVGQYKALHWGYSYGITAHYRLFQINKFSVAVAAFLGLQNREFEMFGSSISGELHESCTLADPELSLEYQALSWLTIKGVVGYAIPLAASVTSNGSSLGAVGTWSTASLNYGIKLQFAAPLTLK